MSWIVVIYSFCHVSGQGGGDFAMHCRMASRVWSLSVGSVDVAFVVVKHAVNVPTNAMRRPLCQGPTWHLPSFLSGDRRQGTLRSICVARRLTACIFRNHERCFGQVFSEDPSMAGMPGAGNAPFIMAQPWSNSPSVPKLPSAFSGDRASHPLFLAHRPRRPDIPRRRCHEQAFVCEASS